MIEQDMENLLWQYPEKFFAESLTRFDRQPTSRAGRPDIVFTDERGALLIMEIKRGRLKHRATAQMFHYRSYYRAHHPDRDIRIMAVANEILPEVQQGLSELGYEWREIPEDRYREVAAQQGYAFRSEQVHIVVQQFGNSADTVCAPGSVNAYKGGNAHDLFRMLHSERPVPVPNFLHAINTTVGWNVILHARRKSQKIGRGGLSWAIELDGVVQEEGVTKSDVRAAKAVRIVDVRPWSAAQHETIASGGYAGQLGDALSQRRKPG